MTACQQAVRPKTIVFGEHQRPNSVVSRWRAEPHDYSLLSDLNTRPRTRTWAGSEPESGIAAAGGGHRKTGID